MKAIDARGRSLGVELRLRGGVMVLRVDVARAAFPVRIDPIVQEGPPLSNGGVYFGRSVAVSGDGTTALVGDLSQSEPGNPGAAVVFSRTGSTWTQQEMLGPNDAVGRAYFGQSVALSADGNTALIGGPGDSAAWVFTRSGSTWTQQGAKLTSSDSVAALGNSVALSADGNTALIGGEGAAAVFTRASATWSQQGPELSPPGATEWFGLGWNGGQGVSLSQDGNTALIGDLKANSGVGAAWLYTRSGSTWNLGPELTPTAGTPNDGFGSIVALSADATTAVVGGDAGVNRPGGAWILTRSGSTWTQQGSELHAEDPTNGDGFGESISLSADGNKALVGGGWQGAWAFLRSGSVWRQQGQTINTTDGYYPVGTAVSISADGTVGLVSGNNPISGGVEGAVFPFHMTDYVTLMSPAAGSYTNNASPTFSGVGGTEPIDSSSVTVNLYAGSRAAGAPLQSLTAPVNPDGSFAVSVSTPLADGIYTVQAEQEVGGDMARTAAHIFTVKTLAPVVTVDVPSSGSTIAQRRPTFSGTGGIQRGDAGSVTLDVYSGSSGSGTPLQTLSARLGSGGSFSVQASAALPDGPYSVQARQVDRAGNTGYSAVDGFSVDTTPPLGFSNLAPADGSRFDDRTPTLQWSASSDAGSGLGGYRVLIDGVQAGPDLAPALTSYTPAFPLADGTHSWQVLAFDNLGNIEPGPVWHLIVDTTPPDVKLAASSSYPLSGADVTFDASASSDPQGATLIDYAWDPQGSGVFASSGSNPTFRYTYAEPGTYRAEVRVTNEVGLSSTVSIPIIVTPAPPAGNVGVLINDGDYATNDPHVQVALVWPRGANQATFSNDGGFGQSGNASTFSLAASIPWTLKQTGSDRLPKIVYVRFDGPPAAIYFLPYLTLTDDIILDETAPTIQSARLLGSHRAHRASAARARRTRRRYAIKIKAKDTIVGICAIDASPTRSRGIIVYVRNCRRQGVLRLARTMHIVMTRRPRYIRVQNAARTWSHWRRLRR